MTTKHRQALHAGLPAFICLLLILIFALIFSLLAIAQHRAYLTNGLDLGNVDQALWNTAQGRFLSFTLMAPLQSRLALHVEPILLLFVPFYWINLGDPELLLIAQAAIVALGAWPLYQIASHHLGPKSQKSIKNKSNSRPRNPPKRALKKSNLGGMAPQRGELSAFYPSVGGIFGGRRFFNSYVSFIINFLSSLPKGGESEAIPPCSPALLLIFPLTYLLLPTLQSAVLFDFHALTLAPTFILFAFLALLKDQNRRFFFFIILLMACKEDMPLLVAMLGLYVGLTQRRWRLAGATIGLSLSWFAIVFFVIQPHFASGGNVQLDRYAWLGDNPGEMLQTLITQPGLVFDHLWYQAGLPAYLSKLLFPTAYLALLNPLTLLPILPSLAINLLSDNPFTWRLEDFHYGAPLAPFLFISTITTIKFIHYQLPTTNYQLSTTNYQLPTINYQLSTINYQRSVAPLFVLLVLIFSLIYHYQRGFTPLARPFIWPESTIHHQKLDNILATIPPHTPLFTQSNLAPHLTHREIIYTDFAYFTDPNYPASTPVEDILLDITAFENMGGLHQFLYTELFQQDNYQLITAQDGILHFKPIINNGQSPTSNPQLPTPFYSFTNPTPPLDHALQVDFADLLRLHNYSLHFNRQEEVEVTIDIEPLQPLDNVQPVLYLLDGQGQPKGATSDLQATLVWHPISQWSVGQIVRLRFNTLPWYTRQTPTYRLALGVVTGPDVWDLANRQPPIISQPTNFAIRLPANGTLLELARIQQQWHIPQGGPQQRQFQRPILPHSTQANFDNQIELFGYAPPQISKSSILSMTLGWQALNPGEKLIRFVQLIGPDGQLYGQNDSHPDFGTYPLSFWQPGEVVLETVTFPLQPDRPSGAYTLHLGWYHPDNGQRLLLPSGTDHVEISIP